jgi:hypothetical protein
MRFRRSYGVCDGFLVRDGECSNGWIMSELTEWA